MKQLYRKLKDEKRLGFYQIATILNKEGRPTRKGTPWYGTQVSAILKRLKLVK